MEAASQIFEGKFAHVVDDDEDASMDDATAGSSTGSGSKRKATNIVSPILISASPEFLTAATK